MPKTVLHSLVALCLFAALAPPAAAENVTLRWRPPASGGAVGYNVYIAVPVTGPLAATPIDVGRPTANAAGIASALVVGVDRSKLLGVEMTSYDALRRESAHSNRILLVPGNETLAAPIATIDFQGGAPGAHPIGFLDWGADFHTSQFGDGNLALAAPITAGRMVSRYIARNSSSWEPYEIEGRLFSASATLVGGIAVRVGAADLGSGFLLGSDSRGVFALAQRGKPALRCATSASTGVSMVANRWFRFRLRYTEPSGRARVRAKVWLQSNPEPAAWQADCWTDVPPATDSGVFAVYREGSGFAYWDDLVVRPVTGTFTPIP